MNLQKRKILLFGFSDVAGMAQGKALQTRLEDYRIQVCIVEKAFWPLPLGMVMLSAGDEIPLETRERMEQLAASSGNEKSAGRPVTVEMASRMLVFGGITAEELEVLLPVCRECGITRNDLKAMLTPHNASWTALRLNQELMEEHARMSGREK